MFLRIVTHEFFDKFICWDPLSLKIERILNLADKYSARFTFFVTTEHVNKHNEFILRKIVDAGHEIASHSHNHLNFHEIDAFAAKEQIKKSLKILNKFYHVTGFRAPYLRANSHVEGACIDCGLKYSSSNPGDRPSLNSGLWSIPVTQPMDYEVIQIEKQTKTDIIGKRWVEFVKGGQVLLFHPWRLGSRKYLGFLEKMLSQKIKFGSINDYLTDNSVCCISFDLDFLENKQVYFHTLKHLIRSPHFRKLVNSGRVK